MRRGRVAAHVCVTWCLGPTLCRWCALVTRARPSGVQNKNRLASSLGHVARRAVCCCTLSPTGVPPPPPLCCCSTRRTETGCRSKAKRRSLPAAAAAAAAAWCVVQWVSQPACRIVASGWRGCVLSPWEVWGPPSLSLGHKGRAPLRPSF
jgi:hypothetical protein